MLAKMNPFSLVSGHYRTFYDYGAGKISLPELLFQLLFPAVVAYVQFSYFEISGEVVSIVVSAASIVAGLMLNLLVLVYTLKSNNKISAGLYSNFDDFGKVCEEVLATISYSVLLCIILVVASFFALAAGYVGAAGRILMVYSGTSVILCLLIVLKRAYLLINFDLKVKPNA